MDLHIENVDQLNIIIINCSPQSLIKAEKIECSDVMSLAFNLIICFPIHLTSSSLKYMLFKILGNNADE
jgi:hypothetical protein